MLQQIIETLDQELLRLGRLREIIAALAHTPELFRPDTQPAEAQEVEPEAAPVRVLRVRQRLQRGGRVARREKVSEKPRTALTSAIPTGPVVVSASAVAKEHAAKKLAREAAPKVEEGTLGAMIRALRQQGAA